MVLPLPDNPDIRHTIETQILKRWVDVMCQIDSNRINSRGRLPFMNLIEKWGRDEVVFVNISETARYELLSSGNPRYYSKASEYIFPMIRNVSPKKLQQIETILFPNGA